MSRGNNDRDDLLNQYKLKIQELSELCERLKNENKKINKEMENFKEKTIDKIKLTIKTSHIHNIYIKTHLRSLFLLQCSNNKHD